MNKTYMMTMEELVYYVMDIDEEEDLENGTSRLLLNADGSLTLLEYNKDVTLVSTNVIGFKIKAVGYTELNIKMHE